jgi:uncharacterized protein (DUF849 family)
MAAVAMTLGGHVRVGFEDNIYNEILMEDRL